jgi:tetratricopeptide (TPR) repeat protein
VRFGEDRERQTKNTDFEAEVFMKALIRAFHIALALSFLLVCPPWAAAQQGSRGGSASGTTGTTTRNVTPVPTPATSSSNSQNTPQFTPQNVILQGEVVQEDGTPPPFGAVIEIVCGNSTRRAATVNLKGHFAIEIGNNAPQSNIIPDASESGAPGAFNQNSTDRGLPNSNLPFAAQSFGSSISARLMGCGLRAQLAGYRSSMLMLDSGFLSWQNEVGTIVVYPAERVRGVTISVASLQAPKDAKKSRERALNAFRKGKFDEAEEFLKAAIKAYPKYGDAWSDLGQAYQRQGRNQEARDAYTKAIELDELFVNPYIRLGGLALSERKWQEASDLTEHALSLDPVSFPEVYYLNALANLQLNRLDIAEKSARQEQRLDSAHQIPQVFLVLANILARKNDTQGSIAELQDYLKYAPHAKDAATVRSVLDQQEKDVKTSPNKSQ